MVTLWTAGREVRELTFSRRFERVADAGVGIWCRFGVEVAGPDAALALVRRAVGGGWPAGGRLAPVPAALKAQRAAAGDQSARLRSIGARSAVDADHAAQASAGRR